MNLAAASRLSVFAILAVAWLIVFATPEYGPVWMVLGAGILTAAWRSRGRWLRGRRARGLWRTVAAVMLLVLPLDLLFLSQSLLHAVLHVALVAQVLMLFEAPSPRLHRLLVLLSLFNLLAATQFTRSLFFAPLFLGYAGLAIVSLTLLHLLEAATGLDGAREEVRFGATRPLALAMGAAVAAVLPLIVLLFLTLPRSEYSFLARALSDDDAVNRLQQLERARKQTGFSDQVELGDYGRVQEDPTVVLRVKFPGGMPEGLAQSHLFWRAGALDFYDGYSWRTSKGEFPMFVGGFPNVEDRRTWSRQQSRGRIPPAFGNTFLVSPYFQDNEAASLEALRADPDLIEQKVFLELPYTDNLVALNSLAAVSGFFPRGLSIDRNGALRVMNRTLLAEKISYTAFSSLPVSRLAELGGVQPSEYESLFQHSYFGPYFRQTYLQLPDNLSPEVRNLVAELTAGTTTVDDRIAALLAHFPDFTYSLDTQQVSLAAVPLDAFLFETRQGYCEHFATAMVIMLRTAGLPARLANGFKSGVWNEPGGFFAVRQADAHTWAEVWVPRHGWIPVDPVPGGGGGIDMEPWLVPEPNSYWVYAQSFWQEDVLGYNMTSQSRIVSVASQWLRDRPGVLWASLGRALGAVGDALAWALNVVLAWIAVLAPATMAAALFLLYIWRHGLPGGALPLPGARGPRVPFYFEMLRNLRRAGLEKRDTDPPRVFAHHVEARRPELAEEVATLTHLYERVRFGRHPLTRDETAEVRATLKRLRRESRRVSSAV